MKKIAILFLVMLYMLPSFSQTMEWHIKDSYVEVKYLGNDLFKVKNTMGKWGVVNEYGKLTIPERYDSITNFVEERALLLDATGQFLKGIINNNGQIIKSFENDVYINYQYFKDGMLAYAVPNGNYYLFGYIDINGNSVIKPKYLWAAPFSNGIAVVQHSKSRNFGLINKSGAAALNDNRTFKFISTPVNNKLLIAVGSTRGEKVLLVNLAYNGKLETIEELETGTIVNRSSDYSTISCQNGRTYFFDDAMRLLSSSSGKTFNEPLTYDFSVKESPNFKTVRQQRNWNIIYAGNSLLSAPFVRVAFCDNEYAIVNTATDREGVLKLNPNGYVAVKNIPATTEFYHNVPAKGNIEVDINGLFASSRVEIGVVGLESNNKETLYTVPENYEGVYSQSISYFIPANSGKYEFKETVPLKVNFYIDGMFYKTETVELTAIHKRGFSISEASAPEYSDSDGNAKISFNVQSLKSVPSSSAIVTVSGYANQQKRFSGNDSVNFSIPVEVPFEEEKTYSFTVTVKEQGCPSYTKTISRTIKHYNLQ